MHNLRGIPICLPDCFVSIKKLSEFLFLDFSWKAFIIATDRKTIGNGSQATVARHTSNLILLFFLKFFDDKWIPDKRTRH